MIPTTTDAQSKAQDKRNVERDAMLVAHYLAGESVDDFCREHQLGERRYYQIIKENAVEKREPVKARSKPMSRLHETIGRRLFEFYTDKGFDRRSVANKLGWNLQVLRLVEKGVHDLTLHQAQDVAKFLRTTVGALIGEY